MRVRYETGAATLIQFAAGTILTIVSGGASVVSGCLHQPGVDCATNTFVTLLLVIFIAGALGVLTIIGYTAQERRSTRLAYILMAIEMGTALIYLFDAAQSTGLTDRVTNFLSFVLAAWIILVAWRLAQAKGGRIVKSPSHRRHTGKR